MTAQWRDLGYSEPPDVGAATAEYDSFAAALEASGASLEWLPGDKELTLDSIYVRDAACVCSKGLILAQMGKPARSGEPGTTEAYARAAGIPIAGRIEGEARLEGGDVAWVDDRSVAVGIGYRSNFEGARQLREILGDLVDEVFEVHLPHHHGPQDVFHLMSVFSPVAERMAAVYSPLLPVVFRQWLRGRGYGFVEVPNGEFESMACNILAVQPGRCVMLDENPDTLAALEHAGVEVTTYSGHEISRKGEGGPTCLTLPIGRDAG